MGEQISGGKQPGRNEPCPCKSGLKYKLCHGDSIKVLLCSCVAKEHMAKLIRQEQKKQGLIPYSYKCIACGHGFDKPEKSTIAPHFRMCPKCNSTDIERKVK